MKSTGLHFLVKWLEEEMLDVLPSKSVQLDGYNVLIYLKEPVPKQHLVESGTHYGLSGKVQQSYVHVVWYPRCLTVLLVV